MEIKRDYEIRQAITLIKEYIRTLIALEAQQTDIVDKLPYETMIKDLSMAIYNLESQYGKNEKEEQIRLFTCISSPSELEFLGTNYLPGSTCFVLQDSNYYIIDINHEWVKV